MILRLAWFLLAVLTATVTGSLVQSLFNLAALQGIGVSIPVALWLQTITHDLIGFAPMYAGVVLVSFALAFPVAALVARLIPGIAPHGRSLIFAAAAATGIAVAFQIANASLPMPTLIAATRTLPGLLAMMACSALGGWVYTRGVKP